MASLQAKIGWKMPIKRENKRLRKRENKNTIMASVQSKIGWKRLRKRENKN